MPVNFTADVGEKEKHVKLIIHLSNAGGDNSDANFRDEFNRDPSIYWISALEVVDELTHSNILNRIARCGDEAEEKWVRRPEQSV